MKSILQIALIAAAAGSHLCVGALVSMIGKIHLRIFMETEAELPNLTRLVIAGVESGAVMAIALTLAFLTAAGLIFAKRVRKFDAFSTALSLSYILALLHLGIAAFAMTITLLRITTTMGN